MAGMNSPIRVSANKRMLERADGTPYFYLADTAWELFHRVRFEEADEYLRKRAEQGFTAIQVMLLEEHDGLGTPNAYGEIQLVDNDPTKPNEKYFEHIDRVVRRANELGIVVALLPTWGDKWNKGGGKGPEIFTVDNAKIYGEWVAKRYSAPEFAGGMIWVLGGDRPVENDTHRDILRSMAEGLRQGDGGIHLITFHPSGGHNSVDDLPNGPQDFNMAQTGHGRNSLNFNVIRHMWSREEKPCLDGEPGYEEHQEAFRQGETGFLNAYDVRKSAWWGVLAGACGHTYGCHAVWQFWVPGGVKYPVNRPMRSWRDSLELEGAKQMHVVKDTILARSTKNRHGLPEGIVGNRGKGWNAVVAGGDDSSFLLAYFPTAESARVRMGGLEGEKVQASWIDPRTGAVQVFESFTAPAEREFHPPANLHPLDWVLALDGIE